MKFLTIKINNNAIKYQFTKPDNSKLTWNDFINLLKTGGQELTNALKDANSQLKSAYFWECLPISKDTLNRPFEFVVIKNEKLNNINQNYSSFKEYIDKNEKSFISRRGATLIIPLPEKNKDNEELDYKNLASFIQNVPDNSEQQKTLWQEVARQLETNLEDKNPRWLSAHGLGVPYLHVRIDKQPIYYSWSEYKEFTEDDAEDSQNDKNDQLPIPNNNQPTPENQDNKPNPPTEENPPLSIDNSFQPSTNYDNEKPNDENNSSTQQNQEVKQNNSDSSKSTNPNNLPWIIGISGGALILISLGVFLWLRKKK
ncbi:DUF6940 family protein [endosymbiont GvMRE of Glomus versiforme]|uniref:DUF6940 family protein n=1 Tax=endosymbiont GvMRE of Glomus versiforme TaxID=2039283 RepID=UPI000EC12363|nr:hypothetical protein [endosymbiont GvMRE of Glomus versiforme]RHZ37251.1 hypothetical protein GvMRE_I1g674 [endosymbiont GvMRE of Glomus versiforme]